MEATHQKITVYRDGNFRAPIEDGNHDELLIGSIRPEEDGAAPVVSGSVHLDHRPVSTRHSA
ncbi:hypothetical protein D3C80_1924270 [compost metagenome]